MKYRTGTLLFVVLAFTAHRLPDWAPPVAVAASEYRTGAVTANVNLRKTPSLQGDVVAGLPKGLPVRIYSEKDDWYQISAKKNYILFKGWVYSRYVKIAPTEGLVAPPPPQNPLPPPAATLGTDPPKPASAAPKPAAQAPALQAAPEPKETAAAPAATPPATEQSAARPAAQTTAAKTEAKPERNIRLLLSVSPLVLAVIALLIAVRALRTARAVPAPENTSGTASQAASQAPEPDRPAITPEKPPVNEKRRAPRLNRLIEVDFSVGGRFYRGFINNLSETGVYVDTPEAFSVGQEITISCPAIDTGGYIKRGGMIVRLTETGIAVHFQQADLA